MDRYTLGELPDTYAVEWFNPGDTVTVSVYNLLGGASVALTSNACIEIGTTGVFRWSWDNITTKPTDYVQYLYIMDNGLTEQVGYTTFGGYPELIAPTGTSTVTITVEETDTTPIADVFVKVFSLSDQLLRTAYTDPSGQVVFNMTDGTYYVVLYKNQVNFSATESLVVSGATTDTYNGEVLTIPVPAEANICRVNAFAFVQNSTAAVPSFDGTATIIHTPFSIDNRYYEGATVKAQFNTTTGMFYWDLPYGALVKINSRVIGITNRTISVPEHAAASLNDLDIR